MEIETLRLVLDYRRDELRLILNHPAERLQRKKLPRKKAEIPSRDQFSSLLQAMRSSLFQNKADAAADLVEFMAYSGCRLTEATQARWQDVNFDRETYWHRHDCLALCDGPLPASDKVKRRYSKQDQ